MGLKIKHSESKKISKCDCMGKWIFVRRSKTKRHGDAKADTFGRLVRKIKTAVNLANPENIDKAIEVALKWANDIPHSKQIRSIITIPKKGTEISSIVPLFAGLMVIGVLQGGADEVMKCVLATSKARKELAEGKQSMDDIEICENLKLKMYKSGLALYTKKQ